MISKSDIKDKQIPLQLISLPEILKPMEKLPRKEKAVQKHQMLPIIQVHVVKRTDDISIAQEGLNPKKKMLQKQKTKNLASPEQHNKQI